MEKPKRISRSRCFAEGTSGSVEFYSHQSTTCAGEMRFSVYVPPQAEKQKVPILYWLSGLTCTEENFIAKAGAQRFASSHGILLVCPDTSPRTAKITGEAEHWDFGLGAGYYVNATQGEWAKHYRMYDYVRSELPDLIKANFNVDAERESIFGHSMGGHGALVLALRNPGRYRSVSAFAPICAPSQCPWGEKAFTRFLGTDRSAWAQYDANELIAVSQDKIPLFIDQGLEDAFLPSQLRTEVFEQTCKSHNHPLNLRRHEGYDHSFYFISTFIADHIEYHAEFLKSEKGLL